MKKSKDFDKWADDARRVDEKRCFVVYYGNDFKLRTLSVVGKWMASYTYITTARDPFVFGVRILILSICKKALSLLVF